MLLLLFDCLLLLFITLCLGLLTRYLLEKIFRSEVRADTLGIFLLGLMFSSFYFNMVSFWWPVDHLSLIPLGVLSLAYLSPRKRREASTLVSIRRSMHYFTSRECILATIGILGVVILYSILPTGNQDSPGYHYLSVLWYEKYKVVPGLANIHGRFAFNPISFIIEAAWSFTGVTGQSIYPLNMVTAGLFYFWLLRRIFQNIHSTTALLYLGMMLFFFRYFLTNLSSPTADVLVDICVLYSLICLFENILAREITLNTTIVPVLVILYSITAKLSSFPLLLALPFVYSLLLKKEKSLALVLKVFTITLFLYVPWLVRNYIMSGYPIFPFPFLDLFHPDWKAPASVLNLELYFIRVFPMEGIATPLWHSPNPLIQGVETWFSGFIKSRTFVDPVFILLAFFSPLYWLILYIRTKKVNRPALLLWFITFISAWFNILNSMVFRFAACMILLSVLFPFFVWAYSLPPRRTGIYKLMVNGALVLFCLYYFRGGITKLTEYKPSIAGSWLLPLKDKLYNDAGNNAGFPYKILRPGIKTYIADGSHDCLNAGLPCIPHLYGEIEMRGDRIDQGFRMIRDTIQVPPPLNPPPLP